MTSLEACYDVSEPDLTGEIYLKLILSVAGHKSIQVSHEAEAALLTAVYKSHIYGTFCESSAILVYEFARAKLNRLTTREGPKNAIIQIVEN